MWIISQGITPVWLIMDREGWERFKAYTKAQMPDWRVESEDAWRLCLLKMKDNGHPDRLQYFLTAIQEFTL